MSHFIPSRPSRVILNFSHRCALKCEWCYVPFDTEAAQPERVGAILDRVADLGFTVITFGGGDPFQYAFLESLLSKAKKLGMLVHVDTHGRSIKSSQIDFIAKEIDLLGLPLDGACASVHDSMRSAPGHFLQVQRCLEWLVNYRARVKINTIVSAQNVADLPVLAESIRVLGPSRWSLYQYWPLGPAGRVRAAHEIATEAFWGAAQPASAALASSSTSVEVNSLESRRCTYPIIHHDGSTFVHAPAPSNQLRALGSIFDESTRRAIFESCSAERADAVGRYTSRCKY